MNVTTWLSAVAVIGVAPLAAQTPPCCSITAIAATTGMVSGKAGVNGNAFQFKVTDARLLASLKVGQAIYANFTTRQVSIDGRSACCTMASALAAPAAPGRTPSVLNAPPPPPPSPTATVTSGLANRGAAISLALPVISYGAPQAVPAVVDPGIALQMARYDSRRIGTILAGRAVTSNIIHLRGLDGIEKAPGLPEGARRLLKMHVRKLQPGEPDHYIVNVDLANEWFKTHAVPDDIQPVEESSSSHSGCSKWTWHCAGEVAAHAADQATQLIQQAQDAWNHAQTELAKDWNTAESCFADNTLPLPNIPVHFSLAPAMRIDLSRAAAGSFGGAATSATVTGSLGLSFPIKSDFTAELDLFYIPCLPFVVRPRQLGAEGTFTVAEELQASASAVGTFDKLFTIPPTGGPRIPIQVIPIVIAGVPVAELDVSAYIEGNIRIAGQGQVDGQLDIKNPHTTAFKFVCGGQGCQGESRGMPDPTTASESAELKGTLSVRPDIFTALQLDFDFDALSARAGPQPYLLAQAAGCVGITGAQSSAGTSSSSESHVLAGDLDWGVDLRAEALVAGKVVGGSIRRPVTGNKHLWWRDLAPGGSTALDALVVSVAPAVAQRAASFTARMPLCYPYTTPVHYQVTWTGSAVPTANPACRWQATQGQGTCTFDPGKDLVLGLTWLAAGSYAVTVVAIGDSHDNGVRVFAPAPRPTSLIVVVSPGS